MPDDEITVFELEERQDRAAVATLLRRLADGIEAGRIVLQKDDERVVVEPPDDLEVELELEMEDDGGDLIEHSLEIELSWFERVDRFDEDDDEDEDEDDEWDEEEGDEDEGDDDEVEDVDR